jgi:hypothetical protein
MANQYLDLVPPTDINPDSKSDTTVVILTPRNIAAFKKTIQLVRNRLMCIECNSSIITVEDINAIQEHTNEICRFVVNYLELSIDILAIDRIMAHMYRIIDQSSQNRKPVLEYMSQEFTAILDRFCHCTKIDFGPPTESEIHVIATDLHDILVKKISQFDKNHIIMFTEKETLHLLYACSTARALQKHLRGKVRNNARDAIRTRYGSLIDQFFSTAYAFHHDAMNIRDELPPEHRCQHRQIGINLIALLVGIKSMLRKNPRKNRPIHRRHKVAQIANPITMDVISTQHTVLNPTEIPDTILVKKTKSKSLYLVSDVARHIILDALKEGKFETAPNDAVNLPVDLFHRLSKNKFDAHQYEIHMWIRLDLHYGDELTYTNRMEVVDILGVHIHKDPVCIFMRDSEIAARINRELYRDAGTHHMCATGTCIRTFRKGTVSVGVPVQCPDCNVTQCVGCEEEYVDSHHGFTCEEVQTRKRMVGITCEYTLRGLIEGTLQPCPECSATTDRIDGCNKMHCTNNHCNAFWCWACGTGDLKNKYPYDPYDHYRTHTAEQKANGLTVCSSVVVADDDNNCFGSALALVIARNNRMWPDLEERLAVAITTREASEAIATT